jgi:hypothetical protein
LLWVFGNDRCPKERHDAVAHDLVDGAFITVHGRHHALQDRIEELPGLFRVTLRQEFHRAFEVRKQPGDLLTLAFEGAFGGEDLLRQIGRGVGEWRLSRELGRS